MGTEFVNNVGVDIGVLFAGAGPYLPALQAYIDHVVADFSSDAAQTGEEVAAVIMEALQADRPALRMQTSTWARESLSMKARRSAGYPGSRGR